MKSLLSVLTLLFNLSIVMGDMESYVGKWRITDAVDEENDLFTLPSGTFFMELKLSDDKEDNNDRNSLEASIKVGNTMWTRIKFGEETAEGDTITVENLFSSRMMPPEHLFRLETFLSNTMPKMTTMNIETKNGIDHLTMSGMGEISFLRS